MASQKDINELLKEALRLEAEAKKFLELKTQELMSQKNISEAAAKVEARKDDTFKKQLAVVKEIRSQISEIKNDTKETIGSLMQQEKSLKGLTGLQASLVEEDRKRIKLQSESTSLDKRSHEALNSIASLNQELLSLSAEDVISQGEIKRQIEEQLGHLSSMPGVSSEIVDNLRNQFETAKGVSSMTEKQQKFLTKQLDVYEGIKDTIGGVLETAQLLMSTPAGVFGAALIAIGASLDKIGQTTREFGGTMGGAVYSTTALGLIFKDATGAAKGLAAEFGGMEDISFATQLNTNLMATNMGISGAEAAKTLNIFSRLNGNSKDTALEMAKGVESMSDAAGLNTAQVMGDVAANAEAFALFSQDGGKNLGVAAVQAAKLGVNLGTLTTITDSLLDFETSITKELELGAMLGKNINLNKARQLAYEGKLGAAAKETIKELGGVAEFNKMDYYAKKQAAALLGISVDELSKMANNMDKLNDDGEFQKGTWDTIGELITAATTGPLGTFLKGVGGIVIALGQAVIQARLMRTAMAGGNLGVKGVFDSLRGKGPTPTPTIPTPEQSLTQSGPDLTKTDIKAQSMGDKLKDLASGLKAMGDPKVLFGAFNLIPTGIGLAAMLVGLPTLFFLSKIDLIKVGVGLSELAIALGFMGTGQVMLGGVALGIVGVGFATMIAGIPAMAFISAFGPVLGAGLSAVGAGMNALGNAAKSGYVWLGVALLAAVGAAMIPYTYAISLLTPVIEAFGNVIMKTLTALPPVITAVADGFVRFMDSVTLEKVAAIGLLSLAFMGLASSLMFLGTAGIFALPALLGISAAAGGLALVAEIFGLGGTSEETGAVEGGSLSEFEETVLQKMDNLIMAVSANKDVYLDKDKVTNLVMQRSDRSILNKLNIFNG